VSDRGVTAKDHRLVPRYLVWVARTHRLCRVF
jgi:hypothetical protein